MLVVEIALLIICTAIAVLCLRMVHTLEAIRKSLGNYYPMAYIANSKELPEKETNPQAVSCPLMPLGNACREIADIYGLSKREEEILGHFARGKSHAAIAGELHIGSATVKTHSSNIYQKLGIHSRDELITLVEQRLTGKPPSIAHPLLASVPPPRKKVREK